MGNKGISRNKGKSNPFFGQHHTEESRTKMSVAHKGKKRPARRAEWSKKISESKKGTMTGAANPFYGRHHTEETKLAISMIQIANPKFKRCGEKNLNWQGGVTCANHQARNTQELKEWRRAIYRRDNWTCRKCGVTGSRKHPINAHHIKSFAKYPELRFEVSNGITLCEDCHRPLKGDRTMQLDCISWIILGARTNPLKLPERQWVEDIERAADAAGVPVFEKASLTTLFPERQLRQEYPEKRTK